MRFWGKFCDNWSVFLDAFVAVIIFGSFATAEKDKSPIPRRTLNRRPTAINHPALGEVVYGVTYDIEQVRRVDIIIPAYRIAYCCFQLIQPIGFRVGHDFPTIAI